MTATERDFEYWAALAKSDPERFGKEREKAIEEALQKIPQYRREKARCFQEKIDKTIKLFPDNPLAVCARLQEMMLERVSGTGGIVNLFRLLHCTTVDVYNIVIPSKTYIVSMYQSCLANKPAQK